jgi:hypothetical protein
MNKNLLIISVIALCCFSCDKEKISTGQAELFIKYYTNYPEFSASDVVITASSGYAVLGTAKTEDAGTQLCLLITDEYGNSLDSAKLYGKSSDDIAYCLKALVDGGYAVLGTSQNPVTGIMEGYFVRTNSIGDTIWTRSISSSWNMEVKYFDVDANGTFFITGTVGIPGLGKQILVAAINDDGSEHWPSYRYIGVTGDEEGTFLQILQDGYLVITGRARNSLSGSSIYQPFILLVNDRGILEDWIEIPSVNELEGVCIRTLDQNNFLVLSTAHGSVGQMINLCSVNFSERIVNWTKNYDISGEDIAKSFLISSNSLYILGTKISASAGNNSAISVITTDFSGNQKARSDFGQGTRLSGVAFVETKDGGLIIAGTNEHPEENNTSVALIKTNADIDL